MRVCADCGAQIQRSPTGRWGHLKGRGQWHMACRIKSEGDRLITADYHYVEGETQRHWPIQKETV